MCSPTARSKPLPNTVGRRTVGPRATSRRSPRLQCVARAWLRLRHVLLSASLSALLSIYSQFAARAWLCPRNFLLSQFCSIVHCAYFVFVVCRALLVLQPSVEPLAPMSVCSLGSHNSTRFRLAYGHTRHCLRTRCWLFNVNCAVVALVVEAHAFRDTNTPLKLPTHA